MPKRQITKRKAPKPEKNSKPPKQQKTSHQSQTQTTTPPLTDSDTPAGSEPKNLFSIISSEELEITIDTLTSLSAYPSLIKSKQCKDLRAAAYDFRSACTTGLNSAGEGTNLTARVSGALADGKWLEARILLAEMRLRGEAPKLGALCRWVRDLDMVSGLSGVKGVHGRGVRSEKEREGLKTLDLVLRVCGVIDKSAPVPKGDEVISLQEAWNMRGEGYVPEEVYKKVLDGSLIGEKKKKEVAEKYRVLDTTLGLDRKPPNHHPAVLYTSEENAVDLRGEGPERTRHEHPVVPNLSLVKGLLSEEECKEIIRAGEAIGFIPDAPIQDEGEEVSVLAHNFYWVVDQSFHDLLWDRVKEYVPAEMNGRIRRGLNRRFRVYRYVPGAEYRCHIDGAWPPSGISPEGKYQYDSSPRDKRQSSLFTFLIYLNDDFEGGETTYFLPSVKEGVMNAYPIKPVMGAVAIFPHGDARNAPLHEGTGVRKGAKYVIRTDVEYDVDPTL
ncbi:hypothetical protein QBC38DRAFT_493594 [Podospora fimiseda]|uniref:Fe2OG dioxygenase domain-containing protein n=1 Tax=Podospora fimiseda TaxID=252190 RepID=A0AAN6YQW5_9PEZI|nr:hypothetical protein QBC38DRAFT_493594 [Podospora fimiseda]